MSLNPGFGSGKSLDLDPGSMNLSPPTSVADPFFKVKNRGSGRPTNIWILRIRNRNTDILAASYLRYVSPTCPALLAMATLEASTWRIGGCWRLLLLIFLTANLRPAQGIMPSTLRQNQMVCHWLLLLIVLTDILRPQH